MLKRVGRKPQRTGIRIPGRLSFATPRYKDPCYGPLTAQSKTQAAEAHGMGNLDLLDGKLRCECGKMVGATPTTEGDFQPDPRPHERYKEPRQPARKRDDSKRIRR